jgi:histidinol dehydrogenase
MQINTYNLNSLSAAEKSKILRRSELDIESFQETVRPVIRDVREQGDQALIDYCAKFDKVTMPQSALQVTKAEFAQAERNLDPAIKAVIERAAANIRKFHQAQMPEEMWFTEIEDGVLAGEKSRRSPRWGCMCHAAKALFPQSCSCSAFRR